MPDEPDPSEGQRCVVDVLREVSDPRQRLVQTQELLEYLAAASKAARDLRDETIVEVSGSGANVRELQSLSGMSRAHVRAMVRRQAEGT